MSVYIDREFLGQIQYRLEGFVQKNSDLYNFRCPFCLDSKKNKSKKRGFIYKITDAEAYAYKCWNCGKSISFGHFLEAIDATAYKQYVLAKYKGGASNRAPVEKPTFGTLKGNAAEYFRNHPKNLSISSIYELAPEHLARSYIEDRRIPQEFWKEIYYAEKFFDFLNVDFPDHGKTAKEVPNDARIVLLYTDMGGYVTHVAGRALDKDNGLRYISIKVSDEDRKIFGANRLDVGKPAYVVEGQFDSMFLDNCVASGDSNLAGVVDYLPSVDWTLVFDNQPRNKDIVRAVEKAIDRGLSVVVFPSELEAKDLNDMVKDGMSVDEVKQLVKDNTYKGATAMIKFIRWKRV